MGKRSTGWHFYSDDYDRDTEGRLRGALEHGTYFLLLKHYWKFRGLPDDDNQLARIAGVTPKQWRRLRPVLQVFFQKGWKHKRVERDLVKAARYGEVQRQRVRKRWDKKAVDNKGALTCPTETRQTMTNPLKNLRAADTDGIPAEYQYRTKHRLPSIAAREIELVDKGQPIGQPPGLPKHNNGSSEARARQKWEAELRTALGYQHHGDAIEVLAGDPDLVSRATRAEMKKEGDGVAVVLVGLKGRLPRFTEDDF